MDKTAPPNAETLALSILESLSAAVLRRVAPGRYAFFGRVPAFYACMFGCTPERPDTAPWERSEMLRFFLDEAETFFENGGRGTLSSGAWQEEGVEEGTALLASAFSLLGEQLIVVRRLAEDYTDRTSILQKAREHLLERRLLDGDLERYKQKARFDALTSLYNREAFMEALTRAVEAAAGGDSPLFLLLLDIDDFKKVNDTYGHLTGDMVLSELGRLLRSQLRLEDLAARYGGEEFAVLASSLEDAGTLRLGEKLRRAVARHTFGPLTGITVSVGCARLIPGESPEAFIHRADMALYGAKRAGKNRVSGD